LVVFSLLSVVLKVGVQFLYLGCHLLGLVVAFLGLGLESPLVVPFIFLVVLEPLLEQSNLLLEILNLGLVGVDLLALDSETLNGLILDLQLFFQLPDLENLALNKFYGFLFSFVNGCN